MGDTQLTDGFCCTCLKVRVTGDKFISLDLSPPEDISYKNKLKSCVPEMGLEDTDSCLLCKPCLAALETAYTFRCMCLRTKSRLKEYKLQQTSISDNQKILKQEILELNSIQQEVPINDKEEISISVSCSVTNSIIPQLQEEENCCVPYDDADIENNDPLYVPSGSEVECLDIKVDILNAEFIHQSDGHLRTSDCSAVEKHREAISEYYVENSLDTEVSELQNNITEVRNPIKDKTEIQELNNLPLTHQSILQNTTVKRLSDTEIIQWCCKTVPELHGYTVENFNCQVSVEKLLITEPSVKIVSERTGSIKNKKRDHRNFWCNICNRNMKRKTRFHAHMLRHANVRGYKCDVCRRGFFSLDSVRIHERKCYNINKLRLTNQVAPLKIVKTEPGLSDDTNESQAIPINELQDNVSTKNNIVRQNITTDIERPIKRKAPQQKRIIKSKMQKCCEQKEENSHLLASDNKSKISTSLKSKKPSMKVEYNDLGDKIYRCELCNYRSFTKGKINVHILHHTATRPFSCSKCPKKYFQKWELNRHMRTTHADSTTTPVTKRLLLPTSNSEVVVTPVIQSIHSLAGPSDQKQTVFSCSTCNLQFHSKNLLIAHTKRHKLTVACTTCSKEFQSELELKHHEKELHQVQNSVNLEIPPISITKKRKRKFYCDVCNLEYASRDHANIHTGDRPYKCPMCEKQFGAYTTLKKHKLTHTKTPVVKTSQKMVSNLRTAYECDICKKKFFKQEQLYSHDCQNASGDSVYRCQICKTVFIGRSALIEHMGIHVNQQNE